MFRTDVSVTKSANIINHQSKILMLGSCFSENMGKNLIDSKFNVNLNPFGVLYNPSSIAQSLESLLSDKQFGEEDLVFYNGLYHSFSHHGSFSNINQEVCLQNINEELDKARKFIYDADILIITFGTAYVYEHLETQLVVSNCHKLAGNLFHRYRLSIAEIVKEWEKLLLKLKEANPKLKTIFTVSPIRHLRDGAHDNQLSKASLLMSIEELRNGNNSIEYFPSYEILLDDLRDYRFYAEDMVHPNSLAIQYIWDKFSESYFENKTLETINDWKKIWNSINHRPINPNTEEHKGFLKQTLLRLQQFGHKYPYICTDKEITALEVRINQ